MTYFKDYTDDEQYVWNLVFAHAYADCKGIPWMAISKAESAVSCMRTIKEKKETNDK